MAPDSEIMFITVDNEILNGERSKQRESVKLSRLVDDINLFGLLSNTNASTC